MPDHRLVAPVYPWQRVARSVALDVIVWGPVVLAAVPQVVEASHALVDGGVIPPALYAQLAALGAGATVVRGVLVRVIALPSVNALLGAIGLGTVPRAAARSGDVVPVKGTAQAHAAISAGE